MVEVPDEPQTLYLATSGWGPLRRWLYIGVTNSPSRRMREHRAGSEWWLEATTVRLRRYPDRASVLEAERTMIKAKRPSFNIQHNLDEIELHVTVQDMAAVGAAVCFGILTLEWLADVASMWWVRRTAAQQGSEISLPSRPNRFTEPSLPLMLGETLVKVATGQPPGPASQPSVPASPPAFQFPASPAGSAQPAGAPAPSPALPQLEPSALGMLVALAYVFAGTRSGPAAPAGAVPEDR